MGIDAFVLGAQSVECLAVLALHALAPIRDANTVIFLRRIRVGAMLGLPRRAPHLYIFGMGPLDVVVFGEATIDQIVGGFVAFSMRGLDPGLCQAAIGAAGIDIDGNDHLLLRSRYDLHVVSGAPSAIGHLHHPRVGIAGRTAPRARGRHAPLPRAGDDRLPPDPSRLQHAGAPPALALLHAVHQAAAAGGTNSPRHPRAPASHPAPTCRPTPNQPEPSTRRPAPEAVPEPPYGRPGSSTGCDSSSTPRRITSDRPDDRDTAGPVGGRCRPHRPWPIAKAPTSVPALLADVRAGPRAP